MPPEQATAQIKALFAYAPRCTFFMAVDNIMPADYPATVFAALTPPHGVCIQYEVRPTLTAEELLARLRIGMGLLV